MSSIIEGYNYDIFISYRQKDNKGDMWVSEFVEALKTELESTFKEEISVYFDINPHDGLLETHDVDASLKEKLKCLVFIPIISRTYCDPKSFAWEHEFKAFVELASKDQPGLKVKLPNGNVASRVLPVRIYDLDTSDIKLCESVLGGVLRSVDFIYKSTGVNRPLRSIEEKPQDNLNNTIYRDQINKVANSIKEIIPAISHHEYKLEEVSKEVHKQISVPKKNNKPAIIAGSIIAFSLIILGLFFIPKLFAHKGKLEKSIAVLPFRNDSPDTTNKYFIDGTMESILNNLWKIRDLTVISRTSVEQFRNTTIPIREIAKKLNVNYILEGSGQKYGNKILLTVQLIDAVNDKHIWSSPYEGDLDNIYVLQSQIAQAVAKELKVIITPQEKTLLEEIPTKNTLAYDYYLKAGQFEKENKGNKALQMYTLAIEQDPLFILAYLRRASMYATYYDTKSGNWEGSDRLAKSDMEKAIEINPDLAEVKLYQAILIYRIDDNYEKALEILDKFKDQIPVYFLNVKNAILARKGQWEESLEGQLRSGRLDPMNGWTYYGIGATYRRLRKYPEAIEFFKKSDIIFDDQPQPYELFYTTILWKGDLQEALNACNAEQSDPVKSPYYPLDYYYYSRQYEKLNSLIGKTENHFVYFPRTLNRAHLYFLEANFSLSRQYADSAIAELNVKIKESPDDNRYYAALGYAYAFKGDDQKAIDNAKAAVSRLPLKKNAVEGFTRELDLTKIYIFTGKYDLAMDKIEYLLTIPGELSLPLLKIDPAYDKLRVLPRFQKILTNEYQTEYQ
jgi:TolB-like protein